MLRDALILFTGEWAFRVLHALPVVGFRIATNRLRPLREANLTRNTRVADVGGRSGALLCGLVAIGFKNLTCIDPYLEGSTSRDGVRFIKATLAEVSETFDVIMYHHALEHVTVTTQVDRQRRRLDGVPILGQ